MNCSIKIGYYGASDCDWIVCYSNRPHWLAETYAPLQPGDLQIVELLRQLRMTDGRNGDASRALIRKEDGRGSFGRV